MFGSFNFSLQNILIGRGSVHVKGEHSDKVHVIVIGKFGKESDIYSMFYMFFDVSNGGF